jgi:hypothetical protein
MVRAGEGSGFMSDQLGHLLMAALTVVLLAAAGLQLWMLRGAPKGEVRYLVWRAAAIAQAACWLILLPFSLVQTVVADA